MINNTQFLIPHLEWEYTDFPVKVFRLKFEKTSLGYSDDSLIEVWRDDNFQLRGKVSGNVKRLKKQEDDFFTGKGNVISGQKISGIDAKGNLVELKECFLGGFYTSGCNRGVEGYLVESTLTLDSLKIVFPERPGNTASTYRQDWFLCKKSNVFFNESTFRKAGQKRVRVGLDKYDDSIENFLGSSSSRDYGLVKLYDHEFIVAEVPAGLLPEKRDGLCFEFRQNLPPIKHELIHGASEFVSFLLGNEIQHLGYTIARGLDLLECFLNEVNITGKENTSPPIRFNRQKNWGDFTWLLNKYLPGYLGLRKELDLGTVMARYWISRNTPVGANLPVLASALEMLVERFLSATSQVSAEYMARAEYLKLIEPVLSALSSSSLVEPYYDPIRNKILNAYKKGPNEKMRNFFSLMNLSIGKPELQAIALRNKMAHSSRNYADENTVLEDIYHTRVYEALFVRVILKFLKYDGYYTDFSLKGCPLKHIDVPAGD